MISHRIKLALATFIFGLSAAVRLASAEQLSLQEVAPGIYVHQGIHELPDTHNQGAIANIGFIVGEKCVAVIDSGGSLAQGEALKAAIANLTATPVCYVINTHVHPDHIYGNWAFRQQGAKFVGHYKLAKAMAMRAPFYQEKARRDLGLNLEARHFVPPDIEVSGKQELDLGNRTLTLTAHRTAHTDNDLSVYDAKTQTLWLADLLFLGHIPVVDGSINGWLAEIESLEKLPVKQVIPGHGPVRSDWPVALQPEKEYLTRLRDEIRELLKQGKTLEYALQHVGHWAKGEWRLYDEFHKRNISTAYAELEWE